jgi:predicted transcriptional regulator
MKSFKEPKNVDLSSKSEPWTENELADFRKLMQEIKAKNQKRNIRSTVAKKKIEKAK